MNSHRTLAITALTCLWLCLSVDARTAAPAAEIVPRKQSLAIPIATRAGRSIQCVVPFGPSIPISAVAFSPDGKTLAVGGYQEVLVWDLAAARLSRRLGVGQLSGPVRALAFGKDGRLAVGEGTPHVSGAVRIFDVEKGDLALSFEEPNEVVFSLAYSPDGKLLVGSGAYAPVHVWSLDQKKLVSTIEGHAGWVLDVSFSADGKFLATAGADRTLRVWEVAGWNSVTKFVQKEAVHGGAFSPDGKTLAAAVHGPNSSGIRLRRTDNPRYNRSLYMPGGSPLDVLWEAKTNRVYVPCTDKTVKVFDGRNNRPVATLSGHEDWVYCVALSADGTKVASGSADGTVKLWNSADGKLLATLVQLSPRTDQWLIITAQGYLATSSAGALGWKATNVKTPAEEITGILEKPELVQKAIAGEKTDPPAIE